jgi:soluble lytic murein transglycosylase-like protein
VIRRPIVLAVFAALALDAAPARAELVFFKTGRSLSIASHRLEGGSLVLTLRSGGEVVCEPSIVASIEPDEVPYPAPPMAAARANATPARDAATMSAAAVRYADLIDSVAAANGVDAALVRAVIQVESAYQPGARSRKGAMGLMQLMPATAQQYGVRNPYDPRSNIEAGSRHLKKLLQRFPTALALAAYNAGESVVERYGGIPPYPETRAYVTRVLALAGN